MADVEAPGIGRKVRPEAGGSISVVKMDDGRFDVSIVAPEGPSAAIYLTASEATSFGSALVGITVYPEGGYVE